MVREVRASPLNPAFLVCRMDTDLRITLNECCFKIEKELHP